MEFGILYTLTPQPCTTMHKSKYGTPIEPGTNRTVAPTDHRAERIRRIQEQCKHPLLTGAELLARLERQRLHEQLPDVDVHDRLTS